MLAQAGLTAVLVERGRFPRDKPCGEGLMPAGARILAEIGLALEGFPTLAGVRYRVPGVGQADGAFLGSDAGRGTRRLRLDERLVALACATDSVEVITRCACTGVEAGPDMVTVRTSEGDLRVGRLVAADGLRSSVAKWLGWYRPPSGDRYAIVGHVQAVGHAYDRVVVTLLPGRELYLAPTGPDEVLLAVLGPKAGLRREGEPVEQAYRRHLREGHEEHAACDHSSLRGAGPFWTRPSRVAGGRVFLIGDAAGFLDPLTGDGMTAGLVAAKRLAALLASAVSDPGRHYARWESRQWRRRSFMARLALALTGHAGLARRGLRGLSRRPAALSRLLEVNEGSRTLSSVSPRDWAALLGV